MNRDVSGRSGSLSYGRIKCSGYESYFGNKILDAMDAVGVSRRGMVLSRL
jgi:hypothetical protein